MNKVEILSASYSHVAGAKGLTRRNYFCRTMAKDIMACDGGCVVGDVDNIQRDVPVRNIESFLQTLNEFGGKSS